MFGQKHIVKKDVSGQYWMVFLKSTNARAFLQSGVCNCSKWPIVLQGSVSSRFLQYEYDIGSNGIKIKTNIS